MYKISEFKLNIQFRFVFIKNKKFKISYDTKIVFCALRIAQTSNYKSLCFVIGVKTEHSMLKWYMVSDVKVIFSSFLFTTIFFGYIKMYEYVCIDTIIKVCIT